jgi:hypothetical protein
MLSPEEMECCFEKRREIYREALPSKVEIRLDRPIS